MASENIQPLSSLQAVTGEPAGADLDPARKDYLEGRKLYSQGEYAQAALAFHNALRGFEEQGDEQGVANAADRLGDACLAREEYAMAIANYRRAFAVCEKEDDSFSQLSLNKKMAAAYRKLGDHEKALELLFDMLEHYRLTNNPKGAVEILHSRQVQAFPPGRGVQPAGRGPGAGGLGVHRDHSGTGDAGRQAFRRWGNDLCARGGL
jgi:tetratricopeptide (TPR) repeat protein